MPAQSRRMGAGDAERQKHHRTGDDARGFALTAARLARDAQTSDLAILDLRQLSTIADYFVVGTSRSDRQGRAVLDAIEAEARALGRRPLSPPSNMSAAWMLADYVDVVVHLFDADHRQYYDLDGLWGDAPRVPLDNDERGQETNPGT